MGRLHDASAMVHSGIRATKGGPESNFICSPIAILSVFFLAMRGARGPTLKEMQTFIGIKELPEQPSPPTLPALDSEGNSRASENENEQPSGIWAWPTTWLRRWTQYYTKKGASGHKYKKSDSSSEKEGKQQGSSKVVFRIATRIYVSPETAATKAFQAYEKDVKSVTGKWAQARELNFREGEKAEKVVNKFVAQETENHIPSLLPSGSITSQTRLLAISAAFFKAGWKTKFNVRLTEQKPFYALTSGKLGTIPAEEKEEEEAGAESTTSPEAVSGGREDEARTLERSTEGEQSFVQVDTEEEESDSPSSDTSSSAVQLVLQQVSTMFVHIEKPPFFVQETDDYIAVGLPYEDTRYVLFVVMPYTTEKLPLLTIPSNKRRELGFEDTEFPYAEDVIAEMKGMAAKRRSVEIYVHMPKFHLKAANNRVDLGTVFKDKLGVPTPFTPGKADFRGIDGGLEKLFINLFMHAAEIEVDEKGTVASGAAALSIAARGLRPRAAETFQFKFDKPFFFQLRYLAQKPKEIWSDKDTDTEGADDVEATNPERPSATEGAVATAAPTPSDDAEHQDLVLFSGNIVDAAAAQS